ncbi:MAG TPA: c-type cytochrome [Thermoanaerobaculia bacterium]
MKTFAVCCLLSALLLSCKNEDHTTTGGGNADRGKQLVEQSGCTACHIIPGIAGPRGMVGPPLEHLGSRNMIAGKIPNTPDNVIKWLQNPQAMDPQNSMPNLGITPNDAKDIAAFLYTLK